MTAHAKTGGSWKTIDSIHAKTAGSWRTIQEGWAKSGGVWRKFFTALSINLTDHSVSDAVGGGSARAGIKFESGGQLVGTKNNDTDENYTDEWMAPPGGASGGDYQVRATKTGGSDPSSGPSLGTWHSLSNDRWWEVASTSGTVQSELLCEIRDASTQSVLASATITISASSF